MQGRALDKEKQAVKPGKKTVSDQGRAVDTDKKTTTKKKKAAPKVEPTK